MYLYPNYILQDLEFDLIIKEVLQNAVTEGGKELVRNFKPEKKFDTIRRELHLVNEFLAVYQTEATFPAMAIEPLQEAWVLLRVKNTTLTAEQIVNIKTLVEVFNRLHRFIGNSELLTRSKEIFGALAPNVDIPIEIDRIIDRQGFVKSSASKELTVIRNEIEKKKQAADRIFYRALKKYQKQNILGEFAETVSEE